MGVYMANPRVLAVLAVFAIIGLGAYYVHVSASLMGGLGFQFCSPNGASTVYCSGVDPGLLMIAFVYGIAGMMGLWSTVSWLRATSRKSRPSSAS